MGWLKKIAKYFLSRDVTVKLNYFIDEFIPPIARDSRLMYPFFLLLFGAKASLIMDFKRKLPFLTEEDIRKYYEIVGGIDRETDLNSQCIDFILRNIVGNVILDVGCGKGYLINRIASTYPHLTIYGVDIIAEECKKGNINFVRGFADNLPFEDGTFDTVICTHVLEHVIDLDKAISEIYRVVRKRVIIVVPRQREYIYTPDLHIHFFPYEYDLYLKLRVNKAKTKVMKLGGDFLIIEDVSPA
ncbi:MAG: class I SAM-dependent methyltransferase [Deltaproteobacteria bacterium]|nr:class I SAM-dependent methyltransferase [Deltaproteobacteria bacterium]